MPTPYPRCTPTEMMGLLVLLKSHDGDQEIARLADDLDLEIDEILPALEFAEVLGYVAVSDGRAKFTEAGKELLASTIRTRKQLIRDSLGRTKLYSALLRALESSPERRLTDEEVNRLISFTTATADALTQNIINWGRYTEMFRYDAAEGLLILGRGRTDSAATSRRPPPEGKGRGRSEAPEPSAPESAPPRADRLASLSHAA